MRYNDLSLYGLEGAAEVDSYSGDLFYRTGDKGYTIGGWQHMHAPERESALEHMRKLMEQQKSLASIPPMEIMRVVGDTLNVEPTSYGYTVNDYRTVTEGIAKRQAQQKEVDFQKLQQASANDIRNMSMAEYSQFRKNYGVGTSTGSGGIFAPEPAKETKFDRWTSARDDFINGKVSLDEVLKYVDLDDANKYDALVDKEIREERAKNVTVHQHGFSWRRWPLWRWLVSRLHWRNLGRHRDWEDDFGTALRQRPGTALRSPLDFSRF